MTERPPYVTGDMIGVHVVSEQVFCPRAMLTTHSSSVEDSGSDESILRLDYAPYYDLLKLQAALDSQVTLLWQWIAALAMLSILGFVLSLFFHWTFFWAGLLAAAIPAHYFLQDLRKTWKLLKNQSAADRAKPMEPSWAIPQDETVNWWSLRAAGFVAHPVDELLIDEDLRLQGRPWRILRKGSLAVPVFVRNGTDELRPQQRARIAAYSHLIRVNEDAETPYGIVLNRGTFEGTAVKANPMDMKRVERALRQIPRLLTDWLSTEALPPPPVESNYAPCWHCPHGCPTRYRPEETETKSYGRTVAMYRTHTNDHPSEDPNEVFHSPCGDHFHWIPEHELAKTLGLRPAGTR